MTAFPTTEIMPFAILRCSSKRCQRVFRGDIRTEKVSEMSVDHFVGDRKVTPWNGTLQCKCDCGNGYLTGKRVLGTESAKKCGAACMGATGPNCDCSCGGRNHGGAHCGE